MARRKIYSNLNKVGQYRPEHVDGQTLYKVFQCLNPDCTEMITVKKDDIDEDYSIVCPKCGYEHYSGGEQHLFDFSMDVNNADGKTVSVQEGEFVSVVGASGSGNRLGNPLGRYGAVAVLPV